MAVIALFDKSFIQSLKEDESVIFDMMFLAVICPIFWSETLADLEVTRRGRIPEKQVRATAAKTPEINSTLCPHHQHILGNCLLGHEVPIDGRIPRAGGRHVKVEGQSGIVYVGIPMKVITDSEGNAVTIPG